MGFFGRSVTAGVLGGARRMRFPSLFFLTAVLFVVDLFLPDFVPFLDEVLLGLATLLFASWREKRHPEATPDGADRGGRKEGDVDLLPPENPAGRG